MTLPRSRSRGIGATTQIGAGGVAASTHRLEREQRDAVGAVLVACALRPLAREAVGRVALGDLQLEPGGRDVLQVEICLAGSGDAGGPEVGLARGTRCDLPLGDDVG